MATRKLSSASPGHWRAALHRASGMASTTTGRVLASMRPYTVVAAISRVGGRSYGLALSDPNLSYAAPLSTVRGPGDAVLCASVWSSPGWQCHSSLAAPPAPRCRWACRCEGPGHPAPVACAARSRRDHTEFTWRPREGHAGPAESAAFYMQACAAVRVARRACRGAAPRRTTPAARPYISPISRLCLHCIPLYLPISRWTTPAARP